MRILHALAALALVLPLSACIEADMTLRPDDSAAGTLAWEVAPSVTETQVRKLLTHEGITVKKVEFKDAERKPADAGAPKKVRRVVAEIEAKKATDIAKLPLFAPLNLTIDLAAPAGGKRKLTVAAVDKTEATKATDPTDAVVKLHLPGAVAETSAKAAGNDVTWTFSSNDYFEKNKVELTVVHATGDASDAAASKDGGAKDATATGAGAPAK